MSKGLANDWLALDADIHTIEFNQLLLDDIHHAHVGLYGSKTSLFVAFMKSTFDTYTEKLRKFA